MIIEFLGHSGCGKTSTAKILSSRLEMIGIEVVASEEYLMDSSVLFFRLFRRLCLIINYFFFNPRHCLLILKFSFSTPQPSSFLYFKLAANMMIVSGLTRKFSSSKKCLVLDQGIFQSLISFGMASSAKLDLYEYASLLSFINTRQHFLVYINYPFVKSIARLSARPRITSRFQNYTLVSNNSSDFFDQLLSNSFLLAKSILSKECIIVLSGFTEIDNNVSIVFDYLYS